MKKLLLLFLLAIGILPVYSQTSIGVIAGYNLSSQYPQAAETGPKPDYTFRSGWRAGLVTDHHLWKKLYLQPQLLLNAKGMHKKTYKGGGPGEMFYSDTRNLRLLYAEIQANLLFKEQLGKGKIFLGAGPYLGKGINGKSKGEGYTSLDGMMITYYKFDLPVKFSKAAGPNPGYTYEKSFDAGINFQAGYELKNGLFLNAVYSLGLTKLSYNDNEKPKNTYLGISVGYFFKKFG